MRVKLLPEFASMSGSIRKDSPYIVRHMKHTGKTYLYRKPQRTPKSIAATQTPEAQSRQANFSAAQAYAKQVLADPNRRKQYEAQWKKQLNKRNCYSTLRGFICSCYYAEYLHNEG